jgi:putative ABC transport system ATP-binding protein
MEKQNSITNSDDQDRQGRYDSSLSTTNIQKVNDYTILKAVNISKVYELPAGESVILRNINFSIKKGEFVSIVGPSGSGKSTLLNIIGALDRPTNGNY